MGWIFNLDFGMKLALRKNASEFVFVKVAPVGPLICKKQPWLVPGWCVSMRKFYLG